MKSQTAIPTIIGIFLFVLFFSAIYPSSAFIAFSLSVLPLLWLVVTYLVLRDTSGNNRPADDPDFYYLPEED